MLQGFAKKAVASHALLDDMELPKRLNPVTINIPKTAKAAQGSMISADSAEGHALV